MDIEFFPFDEQRCPLKFGSWTYHGLELNFTLVKEEADLLQYQPNGEFQLISARAKRDVKKYRLVICDKMQVLCMQSFQIMVGSYCRNCLIKGM